MSDEMTDYDDATIESMAHCRYCGASCDVSDVTLYGAVYDVLTNTRSGGVAICEDCCERFDRNPDALMTEVVNLRERLELARTPCKCDPPGSGEEYCTGHCFLNEEISRLREALRQAKGCLETVYMLQGSGDYALMRDAIAAGVREIAAALAGLALESPQNRALDSLQALQGEKTANDAGMAQDARTARNTEG